MTGAFLETIYCDDVRSEVGNKLSYMGVYGSNFLVPAFPTVLPKICAVMLLHLPESTSAATVTFSLLCNEREIGRAGGSIEEARRAAMPPREVGGEKYLAIRFIAQVSPLPLDAPCRLIALAEVDGSRLQGGVLVVERMPAGEVPSL